MIFGLNSTISVNKSIHLHLLSCRYIWNCASEIIVKCWDVQVGLLRKCIEAELECCAGSNEAPSFSQIHWHFGQLDVEEVYDPRRSQERNGVTERLPSKLSTSLSCQWLGMRKELFGNYFTSSIYTIIGLVLIWTKVGDFFGWCNA